MLRSYRNDSRRQFIFQIAPTYSRFRGFPEHGLPEYPNSPDYCPSAFCIAPASTLTAGPALPDWQTFACSNTFSRSRV